MPNTRCVFVRKKTLAFLFVFLFTANFSLFTSPTLAVHDRNNPPVGSPPAPQPCLSPEITPDSQLTDNFITDDAGDPPGPVDEGLSNTNREALKFTATRTGPMGSLVTPSIHKDMTFGVDFSRLQAIFGANNSNYAEGQFQTQAHAATNIIGLPSGQMQSFQGALLKTAPKVMTDALRENYIKYVWEKPELAESALEFSDYNGQEPKTVHELVQEFGGGTPPQAPKASDDKTTWNATWGKYWEKIPTAYDEFYIGKLEFRAYIGQRAIEQLKGTDKDHTLGEIRTAEASKSACDNFTLLRSVEFPVPRFFRTAQTTGILNQMMLPKVAQSEQNNLINITGGVAGAKTSVSDIAQFCFSLATNNPISKVLKKVVKVSQNTTKTQRLALASSIASAVESLTKSNTLQKAIDFSAENLNPVPIAHAAGCDIDGSDVLPGASKRVTHEGYASGEDIILFGSGSQRILTTTSNSTGGQRSQNVTIPSGTPPGDYFIVIRTRFPVTTTTCAGGPFRVLTPPTPSCTLNINTVNQGGQVVVSSQNGLSGTIGLQGAFGTPVYSALGNLPANGSTTITVPSNAQAGLYVVRVGGFGAGCTPNITVNVVVTPACTLNKNTAIGGEQVVVSSQGGLSGSIGMQGAFGTIVYSALGNLPAGGTTTITVPTSALLGTYVVRVGGFAVGCTPNLTVTSPPPSCTINSPTTLYPGDTFSVNSINGLSGSIQIAGAFWTADTPSVNIGSLVANTTTTTLPIPNDFEPGLYAVRVGGFAVHCGDVSVAEWNLNTPDVSYGNTVNFTISPAPNNNGGPTNLLIYHAAAGTEFARDIQTNNCIFDIPPATPRLIAGIPADSTSITWPNAQKGEFYAVLAKGTDFVSTHTCFQTRFLLEETVTGRDVSFAISPPVHINPSALGAVSLIITNLDTGEDIGVPADLPKDTTRYPTGTGTVRLAPANYRACLTLFVQVWDNDQLDPPDHACTTFNISPIWPWVSAPLDEDSCIKLFEEGKSGNAPYCAIYNLKFDPNPANPLDVVNVIPGECNNQVDQYKLNEQTNVLCNFNFALDSNIMAVDENSANDLRLPSDSNGNGTIDEAEIGVWDECSRPDGGGNLTCDVTINVWPNFRIPFLSQAWNNTLYSDAKETLPTLQETGRPGVYSFAQPKVAQEAQEQDPQAAALQALVDACRADPPTGPGDLNTSGCADLANWSSSPQADEYPALRDCIENNLFAPQNMTTCLTNVTQTIIDGMLKLPGQVNTAVQGANTINGQVLADNTGQKERFIGGVECGKHLTRDIMLKPKVLQQHLGVEFECDLTASTEATNPQDPGGGDPGGGDPGGGDPPNNENCGGTYTLDNPVGNFGDPNCNFSQSGLYTRLQTLDPANADYWFFTIVPCESGYNPNAYNPAAVDPAGAWGLFQMGRGRNGQYDHGDVEWNLQASNAVNYNGLIGNSFAYWACR